MVIARFLLPMLIASSVAAGQLGVDVPDPYQQDMSVLNQIKADSAAAVVNEFKKDSFDWAKVDEMKALEGQVPAENKPVALEKIEESKGASFVIYVSWSLGEGFIKSLIQEHVDSRNVVIKFRGIPDGATMIEGLSKIQRISTATKSGATVELDPVSFQDNGVSMVPAVVRFEDGKRTNIAFGTASIDVFKGKEKTSDLGVIGDQAVIAEKDMIEMMKERAAKVNWQDKKEKAIRRFWAGQTFIALDEAPAHRMRKLDPTVIIPQDMKTADGQMIHAAGTRINPLAIRPFTQRMVIIDPAKEWQLTLARDQIERFGKDQLVTIVLTQLDRDTAWDELKKIEAMLDQPAFILPNDVKERFDIEYVPAVVTADRATFFIEEFSKRDQK